MIWKERFIKNDISGYKSTTQFNVKALIFLLIGTIAKENIPRGFKFPVYEIVKDEDEDRIHI